MDFVQLFQDIQDPSTACRLWVNFRLNALNLSDDRFDWHLPPAYLFVQCSDKPLDLLRCIVVRQAHTDHALLSKM